MDTAVLEKAVTEAEEFRARFINENCRSEEDAIALAVALAQQAEIIWKTVGSAKQAAAQFYAFADRLGADAS